MALDAHAVPEVRMGAFEPDLGHVAPRSDVVVEDMNERGHPPPCAPERQELRDAIAALDAAMQGILKWIYTLKPVLRNELLQMSGPHLEKLREARNRLATLAGEPPPAA